jgi:dephospho-CoA kinase
MLTVGLTGGLASGKSFVAQGFADFGCLVVHADELGHRVLDADGEAYAAVLAEFGHEIRNADGSINRRTLAAMVFNNPARLEKLNSFVHPPVRARTRKLLDDFERSNPRGIAVVEAAILVETGAYRSYDKLIVAACRPDQQLERAMSRDQLTREEALARMSRQMPLEEKVKYADFVIDTSGTKQHTIDQTRALFENLVDGLKR